MEIIAKDIVQKINDKLRDSGWYNELLMWWESPEWEYTIQQLIDGASEDRRFTPDAGTMLRFLYECPVDKMKVIVLNDYTNGNIGKYVGHMGIAWASNKGKTHPVLEKMYWSIQEENIKPKPSWRDDTVYWSNQGVLMLPMAPTCVINGKGQYSIWKKFLARVIDHINIRYSEIPWLFMGDKVMYYDSMVDSPNKVYASLFPEIRVAKEMNKINDILLTQSKMPVIW